jgi:hypothetical protein
LISIQLTRAKEVNTLPEKPPLSGRRRGDAILLAWHYALGRGDTEVAAQLEIEYKKIQNRAPPHPGVERRRKRDNIAVAHIGLWAWFWGMLSG